MQVHVLCTMYQFTCQPRSARVLRERNRHEKAEELSSEAERTSPGGAADGGARGELANQRFQKEDLRCLGSGRRSWFLLLRSPMMMPLPPAKAIAARKWCLRFSIVNLRLSELGKCKLTKVTGEIVPSPCHFG